MEALKCLIATAACLSALGCSSQPKVVVQIEKEILLQSSASWDGTPYQTYPSSPPELTLLRLKIPANTQLPWHSHPMPNIVYVVSGELRIETRDGKHTTTVQAGQVLPEVINTVHRGVSTDKPVELIVFYAGSPGMPLSQ